MLESDILLLSLGTSAPKQPLLIPWGGGGGEEAKLCKISKEAKQNNKLLTNYPFALSHKLGGFLF